MLKHLAMRCHLPFLDPVTHCLGGDDLGLVREDRKSRVCFAVGLLDTSSLKETRLNSRQGLISQNRTIEAELPGNRQKMADSQRWRRW